MPRMKPEQIYDKLRDTVSEFSQLVAAKAPRQILLNGDKTRHGLNHINELFQMLPDEQEWKFVIRE